MTTATFLATNEVHGVWTMVQQRTSYTVANFWKLIWKRRNAIDRHGKRLRESKPHSFVFAGVPCFGVFQIGFGTVPDNDRDHPLPRVCFRRAALTSSHGRPAVRIGLEVRKSFVENLSMPVRDRHQILFGGDSVPERLDVFDLLIDLELVKSWRRKWQSISHDASM